MTTQRSTGSRQTTVRPADRRIAGHYEPTREWPTPDADFRSLSTSISPAEHVACSGRLGSTRTFDYLALVCLARQLSGGRFGVPMIDLLAAVNLDRSAEVIVFADGDGEQLAVPVRDLMQDGAIVLGTMRTPFASSLGHAFLLDVPGWTDDHVQIVPRSLRAVSFAEFVRCQ